MAETGSITPEARDEASRAPLGVVPSATQTRDAPYYVDMVKDQLLEKYTEKDLTSSSLKVYTGLDLDLQKIASEAIQAGIKEPDEKLAAIRKRHKGIHLPELQVALICLYPHTGEIKALQGGRSYGVSQLNRILAKRQPGSSFKPIVYAAAFSSAIDGSKNVIGGADRRRRRRRGDSPRHRLARPADPAASREGPQGRFRGDLRPGRGAGGARRTASRRGRGDSRPRQPDAPTARPGPAHLPPAGRGRGGGPRHAAGRRSISTRSALDSIADIAGAAVGLDLLGVERFTSRSVPTGQRHGQVRPRPDADPGPGHGRAAQGRAAGAVVDQGGTDDADRGRHPHDASCRSGSTSRS